MRRIGFLVFCVALLSACTDSKKQQWENLVSTYSNTGKMRTDRSPVDAPLSADLLAKNFELIAFEFEDNPLGRGKKSRQSPAILRRWEAGLHYNVIGPIDGLGNAKAEVARMTAWLSKLSQRQFSEVKPHFLRGKDDPAANVLIMMGDGDYFDLLTTPYARNSILKKGSDQKGARAALDFVEDWHESSSPCAATVFWRNEQDDSKFGTIVYAVVAIRTDIGQLLLQSCVEEELAQIMGLTNDDASVRPSLFNDDQEFSLLTNHDILLLRTLYDGRLKSGMPVETAMPIVRQIVSELIDNPAPLPTVSRDQAQRTSPLAGKTDNAHVKN